MKDTSLVYYSPTKTTKKVVEKIANGMGTKFNIYDLTSNKNRVKDLEIKSDIVIIGTPVYEDKIPKTVRKYIENIKFSCKYAIIVAVYGNVSDGIVLTHLSEIMAKNNVQVIGAGTFIGQHSYASENLNLANGRPNKEDLEIAFDFGRKIKDKLSQEDMTIANFPTKKLSFLKKLTPDGSAKLFAKVPKVNKEKCTKCGECITACPVNAINLNLSIDKSKCTRCFACANVCKFDARQVIVPKMFQGALKDMTKEYQTPKFYL